MSNLIYLASPYSHPDMRVVLERFDAVCRVAAIMMSRGEFVFSPIAHTHPIAVVGDLPKGFDYWQTYDHMMLDMCGGVAVLTIDGWKQSVGVADEIRYANSIGLPVRHIGEDGVYQCLTPTAPWLR